MSTPISVVGTIATVPKLIRTGAGVPLCSFRLASSERRYDRERGEWIDNGTNWYSVTAFRSLAQHSHFSFQKGDRVLVSGRLRVRKWENKERSGTSVEIEADALGHELRWGTTRFAKQLPQPAGEVPPSLPAPGASSESEGSSSSSSSSTGGVNPVSVSPDAPRPLGPVESTDQLPGWAAESTSESEAADSTSESAAAEHASRSSAEPRPPVGIGWATVGSRNTDSDSDSGSDSDEETNGAAEEELPLAS